MKIFCDTNILLEVLLDREEADSIETILNYASEHNIELYISTGSLYTIVYTVDKHFRQKSIEKSVRLSIVRNLLHEILKQYIIAIGNNEILIEATDYTVMSDIEDAFQFKIAEHNQCDVLLTINIKDYQDTDSNIKAMTPTEFISKIIATS